MSVRYIHGVPYVFLDDVHNFWPKVTGFKEQDGTQVLFVADDEGRRVEPLRIIVYPGETLTAFAAESAVTISDRTILEEIRNNTLTIQQNTDVIQRNTVVLLQRTEAILRATYELAEYSIPRLFIVLVDKPSLRDWNAFDIFQNRFRLFFVCECRKEELHLAFHGGYVIKQNREFFRKYGPYIKATLSIMKYAVISASFVLPQLAGIASNINIPNFLQDIDYWDMLKSNIVKMESVISVQEDDVIYELSGLEGADLRQVEKYIKITDEDRTLGNLFRTLTDDGSVRWVCVGHYKKSYVDKHIAHLKRTIEGMGGHFDEQSSTVSFYSVNLSNKYIVELCNAFKKGTPLFEIKLDRCYINRSDLDYMMESISNSAVKRVSIVNPNISQPFIGANRYKPIINFIGVNNTCLTNFEPLSDLSYRNETNLMDLAAAITLDKVLESLSLPIMRINSKVCNAIAEALKINQAISQLNLSGNEIGDECAKAIAEALKINRLYRNWIWVGTK